MDQKAEEQGRLLTWGSQGKTSVSEEVIVLLRLIQTEGQTVQRQEVDRD